MEEVQKTALVLGGGGSRGAYEIGVWQALRELGIPVNMVTGTSVGAINGAMIAQDAFELAVSLWKEIDTPMVFDCGDQGYPRAYGDRQQQDESAAVQIYR